MRFLVLTAFVLLATAGCAHSTIVPLGSKVQQSKIYAPTHPASIEIYRTHGPFSSFSEIGLITFHSSVFDVPRIYGQLREDAGAAGADAIIDLKITSETHMETDPVTVCNPEPMCDPNGVCNTSERCYTEWMTKEVSTFLATGTLIKRSPQ